MTGKSPFDLTDLHASSASRLASDLGANAVDRAAAGILDSPIERALREVHNPLHKLAEGASAIGVSQTARAIAQRGLVDNLSTVGGANELAKLGLAASYTATAIDSPTLGLLRDGYENSLLTASAQFGTSAVGPANSMLASTAAIAEAVRGAAGLASHVKTSLDPASAGLAASAIANAISGPLGTVASASRWAERLLQPARIESLLHISAGSELANSIGALSAASAAFTSAVDPALRHSVLNSLGAGLPAALHGLDRTSLKLSVFAGASDILGARSPVSAAAFESILGRWATSPALPDLYWRDPAARLRMYQEADVDEALSEAPASAALEILIDSGVVLGGRAENGSVSAVISFGGVSATLTSRHARTGAFRILDAFEAQLREFVTESLEPLEGPQWFKRRTPGPILAEAKLKRETALINGEQPEPLINYTDLGHLIDIVTYGKNWESVFEPVFENEAAFRVDMQRLVASRRPTAHVRTVDAVRLTEIVLIVHRLSRRMNSWSQPVAVLDDE